MQLFPCNAPTVSLSASRLLLQLTVANVRISKLINPSKQRRCSRRDIINNYATIQKVPHGKISGPGVCFRCDRERERGVRGRERERGGERGREREGWTELL